MGCSAMGFRFVYWCCGVFFIFAFFSHFFVFLLLLTLVLKYLLMYLPFASEVFFGFLVVVFPLVRDNVDSISLHVACRFLYCGKLLWLRCE